MRQTHSFAVALAAVLSTAVAVTASARSLLYYYDFDMVDASGNLVVTGVNKGTGSLEPSVVNKSGNAGASYNVGKRAGGAFGDSSYAIYTGSDYSLWLPAPAADLGCSTTNGFTISLWIKPPANTATTRAWHDFFGFRINENRYYLEYSDVANEFRLYGAVGLYAENLPRLATVSFTPDVWSHLAIVATPNAPNDNGTMTLYFNGESISTTNALGKGVLKQIYIGQTVLSRDGVRSEGWSNTAIDEFALFDYPASAEQVKWLTKHRPGQPTGGPGREMPLCWRFERDNGGYAETWNTGTGESAVQPVKMRETDVPYTMKGALNTISAFQTIFNGFTFAAMDDEAGLGATIGSGFSFSFWLYAAATPSEWADFFGFYLGSRNAIHLEWTNRGNPISFCAYGGNPSGEVTEGRVGSTWQHVALTYDAAKSAVDVYLDGVKRASTILQTPISQADCLKRITVGPASYYFDNNGTLAQRTPIHQVNTSVDELAFFNYSISPEEIAWLGSNIPKLPPLSATNLARTVSAGCSWAGALALWNVLDGTGADTGRLSIYPSCEDTEVEVAVSIAASATIANDTFVTPAKLKFTNGTGGASATATLAAGANSMFAPENLEVGDGVTLTVAPGEVSVADTLTFGDGAKIVFDMSNTREGKIVKGISFGSTSLPSAESDLLSHFATRGGICEIILSDDGKTVNIKKSKGLIIFVR